MTCRMPARCDDTLAGAASKREKANRVSKAYCLNSRSEENFIRNTSIFGAWNTAYSMEYVEYGWNTGGMRAQLQNRAFLVRDQSAKDHFWVRDRGRQVRDRSPPHTPADGHHRCFWLRHRSKRAQCARRHRASTPVRRAACCVDAFLWLSSRAFCDPAGGRICVV